MVEDMTKWGGREVGTSLEWTEWGGRGVGTSHEWVSSFRSTLFRDRGREREGGSWSFGTRFVFEPLPPSTSQRRRRGKGQHR